MSDLMGKEKEELDSYIEKYQLESIKAIDKDINYFKHEVRIESVRQSRKEYEKCLYQ